jgi:hypothetical protein
LLGVIVYCVNFFCVGGEGGRRGGSEHTNP